MLLKFENNSSSLNAFDDISIANGINPKLVSNRNIHMKFCSSQGLKFKNFIRQIGTINHSSNIDDDGMDVCVCVEIVEPFDTISIIHHNSIIAISPISKLMLVGITKANSIMV